MTAPTAPTPHERLERAMWDLFWIPDDVTVIDRPDLLLLRCDRPVQMLNSVLRAVTPSERIDALVDEVGAAHAHAASRWWVPDTRPGAHVETALARAGYLPGHQHEARGLAVARFRPRPGAGLEVHAIDSVERMRHGVEVVNQAFGRHEVMSEAQLAREVALCNRPDAQVHRFIAYDASTPVAAASMTSFPGLGFGFLWGGGTIPSARGRGAYSALLAIRLARARQLGLELVGLYARTTTSAPIVARLGFERWGEMTYWDRPSPA